MNDRFRTVFPHTTTTGTLPKPVTGSLSAAVKLIGEGPAASLEPSAWAIATVGGVASG